MAMVEEMTSGNLSITLVENIARENFPSHAKQWIAKLGAKVCNGASDLDVVLLEIELSGELFYLAWDIWQNAITLESTSANGDKIIENLKV